MQTEDMCPGTTDFKVMKEKKCAFEGIEEEIDVIGVNTCGGCPGKKTWYNTDCPLPKESPTNTNCSSGSISYKSSLDPLAKSTI